jgi:glycosyltransferase involved in cell wall biosynthesis
VSTRRPVIAHVLTSLCVGGGERMALGLASSQVRLGHRVLVVSLEEPPDGPLGSELEHEGIELERVPKRPTGWDPSLTVRLARRLAAHRASVVHTHNPLPLIYAAVAGRLCGARVIHTKHGAHPDRWHRICLRRLGAASTHAFVAVSAATAQAALELREVAPHKLRVILNGVDVERFARSPARRAKQRASWGVGERGCVIGTVGRMAAVKNHALLLQAVAPLLGRDVVLVIAGAGPERDRTAAQCRELGIEAHVRLLGEVSDVPGVLSGFDVFALSSQTEGMPMVLAEAMAASLPLVSTAVGGVPEMVDDGVNGYLVAAGDALAMRARLETLSRDPDHARRLGERGRERARQAFSLGRMTREYLAIYGLGR